MQVCTAVIEMHMGCIGSGVDPTSLCGSGRGTETHVGFRGALDYLFRYMFQEMLLLKPRACLLLLSDFLFFLPLFEKSYALIMTS
jgi:hypothetical protein